MRGPHIGLKIACRSPVAAAACTPPSRRHWAAACDFRETPQSLRNLIPEFRDPKNRSKNLRIFENFENSSLKFSPFNQGAEILEKGLNLTLFPDKNTRAESGGARSVARPKVRRSWGGWEKWPK